MATLYVTEYNSVLQSPAAGTLAAPCPPIQEQTVAIGGSSTQPAKPFSTNTRLIRVHVDAICSVAVGGSNPVATVKNARMAANNTEYFSVQPGDTLAVITNS